MINRLPLEILQQIFVLSCPPSYKVPAPAALPFQFTIAHVSPAWRKAALGYTALWSDIDINSLEYWDMHAKARKSALFQFAIAASAPAPLSLSLTVSSFWNNDPIAFELLETAALVSPRWRHARINIISMRHTEEYLYDEVVRILGSIRNKIPRLESLELYTPCVTGLEDILSNAPVLQHINGIDVHHTAGFKLPWSQLQTLKLSVQSRVSAAEVLAYLRNMQVCTTLEVIARDRSSISTEPNALDSCINLPRVHTATLDISLPFALLSLPSLQNLFIGRMLAQDSGPLADMLVRSRTMLSTLFCPETVFLDQRVASACSSLLHLVAYTRIEERCTSLAPVETVLEWLHNPNDSPRCPQLESLHIVHYVEPWDPLSADGVFAWVDILRQARSNTLKRINIVVGIDVYDPVAFAHTIEQSLRPSLEMQERLERGPCAVDIVFSGRSMVRQHVIRNAESEHDDLPEILRGWEERCAVFSNRVDLFVE
ncbi:hypothetical protein CYLTODRAFT_492913 [Cylindrobasidium torrendii FP15055 ss-10]|uniref:F-box domain-containing protein n=1 Tax=Cylindrobasidium torrendii FP15055 ss-10 TaxID=1314674 RepID=A0A0D7B3A0_9AGAR|nr:hypothetical protein CYLTODRAFT_492913 [Cylindrobasidium torrendii FP15055 ss-10]